MASQEANSFFTLFGFAFLVVWVVGYYHWVDRPLRRQLSRWLGGEVGRYHKFWRYDGPLWKAGLLLIIELAVRFIVVLLPLLILILLDVAVRGK